MNLILNSTWKKTKTRSLHLNETMTRRWERMTDVKALKTRTPLSYES